LFEESLDLVAAAADAKRIELCWGIAPDVPPAIAGDVARLRQILVNLLSNAVKFTERGSVVLQASLAAPDAGGARLDLAVADTGIGVPPDRIEGLFEAFAQADPSTTRRYEGTGLGLALSQRLCALLGGEIAVESQVGEGTLFTIRLPASGRRQR
jgi:signal transduction histidine kinase